MDVYVFKGNGAEPSVDAFRSAVVLRMSSRPSKRNNNVPTVAPIGPPVHHLSTSTEVTYDCGICLETVAPKAFWSLPCGHGFCRECLTGLLERSEEVEPAEQVMCPMCRKVWTVPSTDDLRHFVEALERDAEMNVDDRAAAERSQIATNALDAILANRPNTESRGIHRPNPNPNERRGILVLLGLAGPMNAQIEPVRLRPPIRFRERNERNREPRHHREGREIAGQDDLAPLRRFMLFVGFCMLYVVAHHTPRGPRGL